MYAVALIKTADGRTHELVHGDMIGRIWSAALQLDDARISEAHALVSLRGSDLKLLALRGAFAVAGRPCREAALDRDLEIEIAPGLMLRVIDVRLPPAVLGITGDRSEDDGCVAVELLGRLGAPIASFRADGAYDTRAVYASLDEVGMPGIDDVGRRQWRKESGAHQQARAENGIYRFKQVLGVRLRSRSEEGQSNNAVWR